RQLDEFRNLQKQLPPLGSPLAVPTPLAGKLRELTPSELDTFQLVLDHGQLQKVLDNFPGTDLDAAQNLISLMKRELVVVPSPGRRYKRHMRAGRLRASCASCLPGAPGRPVLPPAHVSSEVVSCEQRLRIPYRGIETGRSILRLRVVIAPRGVEPHEVVVEV